jgi:hypothetical protein
MWITIGNYWELPHIENKSDSISHIFRIYKEVAKSLYVENCGIKMDKQIHDEQFLTPKHNIIVFLENIFQIIHSLMKLSPAIYDLSTEDIHSLCG